MYAYEYAIDKGTRWQVTESVVLSVLNDEITLTGIPDKQSAFHVVIEYIEQKYIKYGDDGKISNLVARVRPTLLNLR